MTTTMSTMSTQNNAFGLDDLSKIEGAQSSESIETFFKALDKYISDDDVKQYENSLQKLSPQSLLRDDTPRESTSESESTVQTILDNFPQKHERQIVVPKIIE